MPAITISRQMGSLGTQIARQIADRLGYKMVWREVINEAACRACAPEVALAVIDDLGLLGARPSFRARRAYQNAVAQVMAEWAEEGEIVIVGRAGQVILGERDDIMHVRIIAPLSLRIERMAEEQDIPTPAAKARVEESDRSRRHYLRRYYHVDWNDPELYDLTLNTQRLSIATAADLVIAAWTQFQRLAGAEGAP
ncbi:MAG: AAA family ATPase [Anaerolineae bacterium]